MYIVRQEFISSGKWIRYQDLDQILKLDTDYPDYRNMPGAQSAQQLLKIVDNTWKSFFNSIKDWSKHKDKYLGRPNLPKYLKKSSRAALTLTNQNVRLLDNVLKFPKTFNGFTLNPQCIYKDNFKSIQQVRFVPKSQYIVVEVIYNVEIPDEVIPDNGRYMSIDLGVDNLATITYNFKENPKIINGRGLKSINQYYNKCLAHYQSIAKMHNDLHRTNRINKLTSKRNRKISDCMHKISRYVIHEALKHDICTIVIGHNKEWKQSSEMSKKVNQKFIQIPFNRLIQRVEYKAREVGIKVILTEESYTSGTSFLDLELPIKEFYNRHRRIHRGLFKSNNGKLINADVNGSLQIMKKVFPNAYDSYGIEGVVLHPIKVNAC
jgi:putative transposase